MARRRVLIPVLLATVALLVGCSSSYHAGDQAAREWNAWVKDNPLDGARVTDAVGTNVQPFQGTFEAYARLTATPSETSIVTAMASMCRFDKETSSATTYWLQVDRVSLQAPCKADQQQKVAGFWSAIHQLPGIDELAFSTQGLALTATDAAITALVPAISQAAGSAGWAHADSTNDYVSKHVKITQDHGQDLSPELGFTQGVLDTVGADVKAVEVVAGRVSVATKGTVAQARDWQSSIGHGSAVLTVTPNRVTTEVALTGPGRDLLERLSTDPRVVDVAVLQPFWTIAIKTTEDARGLVKLLDDEPGAADLGRLTMDIGTTPYNSAMGTGRACFVRPVFPERNGRAEALFDLCDRKAAIDVDDRFDVSLDVRLTTLDLPGALGCLRRMPLGQPVYLMLPQNDTIEFSTGEKLAPKFPDSALAKELSRVWDSLPPS